MRKADNVVAVSTQWRMDVGLKAEEDTVWRRRLF
jgi:hypothetical protein